MTFEREMTNRPLEILDHPPQTPLEAQEIEELARNVANTVINHCKPIDHQWTRRDIGNPAARVEVFPLSLCSIAPATIEILTSDSKHARTTLDIHGNIHAIVSQRSGPYLVDSKEAREAMLEIVNTVFTDPELSANSHR